MIVYTRNPLFQNKNILLVFSVKNGKNYWTEDTQNDALTEIYQQDEFKILKPNFEKDLRNSIEIIIQGIKSS